MRGLWTLDFARSLSWLLAARSLLYILYTRIQSSVSVFFVVVVVCCVWDIEVYSHDYGFVFLCAVSLCVLVLFIHTRELSPISHVYRFQYIFLTHKCPPPPPQAPSRLGARTAGCWRMRVETRKPSWLAVSQPRLDQFAAISSPRTTSSCWLASAYTKT